MAKYSNNISDNTIKKLIKDLDYFLELSAQDNIELENIKPPIETNLFKCWEEKSCEQTHCHAYKNPLGRCWLTAGTMCCGDVEGIYAKVFHSCKKCDIYKKSVYQNPLTEIEEKLLIIIHELYCKQSELNQWATTDFLTGLYNRRYFDLFIHSEIEKVRRNEYKLFVTLIDINDFKNINDQFGHLTGDNILKECAKILTAVTRKSDLLIRYGGDEFLVVSYETADNENTADNLIKRIIGEVNTWNKESNYLDISLSLSFGYSTLSQEGSFDEVIEEADRNMYLYKKQLKKSQSNNS